MFVSAATTADGRGALLSSLMPMPCTLYAA